MVKEKLEHLLYKKVESGVRVLVFTVPTEVKPELTQEGYDIPDPHSVALEKVLIIYRSQVIEGHKLHVFISREPLPPLKIGQEQIRSFLIVVTIPPHCQRSADFKLPGIRHITNHGTAFNPVGKGGVFPRRNKLFVLQKVLLVVVFSSQILPV